jgi:hypothetical protein
MHELAKRSVLALLNTPKTRKIAVAAPSALDVRFLGQGIASLPKSVRLLSTLERGGMAHSELEFEFEKTSLDADLYKTPDEKVQEFLFYAK